MLDRRTCVYGARTATWFDCVPAPYTSRATFEEHRYDALGRRVLVRTSQQRWACGLSCVDGVTRTVWDGDQVVAEIRAPLGNPERDAGLAVEVPVHEQPLYGRVLYTHGGALDRPLSLVRLDYDSVFPQAHPILPHTNWLGNYDSGTFAENDGNPGRGRCIRRPRFDNQEQAPYTDPYGNLGTEGGQQSPARGDSVEHCVEVPWPALYLWKTFQSRQRPTPVSWMGSLVVKATRLAQRDPGACLKAGAERSRGPAALRHPGAPGRHPEPPGPRATRRGLL